MGYDNGVRVWIAGGVTALVLVSAWSVASTVDVNEDLVQSLDKSVSLNQSLLQDLKQSNQRSNQSFLRELLRTYSEPVDNGGGAPASPYRFLGFSIGQSVETRSLFEMSRGADHFVWIGPLKGNTPQTKFGWLRVIFGATRSSLTTTTPPLAVQLQAWQPGSAGTDQWVDIGAPTDLHQTGDTTWKINLTGLQADAHVRAKLSFHSTATPNDWAIVEIRDADLWY